MTQQQPPARPVIRVPLTSGQHVLHLILTLFTFGLWGIVWLIRGLQGNKIWADVPNPRYGYYPQQPPYGWQPASTVLHPLPGHQPPRPPFPQYGVERGADGNLTFTRPPEGTDKGA